MSDFLNNSEKLISKQFLTEGYLIKKTEDLLQLNNMQAFVAQQSAKLLKVKKIKDNLTWLNNIHNYISPKKLNSFRLDLIHFINEKNKFREIYYNVSKSLLNTIVGNELAMQKRINLSIQLPEDDSSLLPVHADTWSGDSPFEAVVWIPLVDCYNTKTMYILPPKKTKLLHKRFKNLQGTGKNNLFEFIKNDVVWLDVKFGDILIFNQSLPHGNVVNNELETRWSMNCRFKGIFTPYNDKKLGEFFDPITLKPLSILGMDYQLPKLKS